MFKKLLLSFAMLVLAVLPALADTAVLDWTANTEADLAGYKVYRSTVAGSYTTPIVILGKVITYSLVLPTLTVDQRYYYTITAYDTAGLESTRSNEVSKIALVSPGVPVLTGTALNSTSFNVTFPEVIDVAGVVAGLEIRYAVSPIVWATATNLSCTATPCVSVTATGLLAATTYQVQGVAYRLNTSGGKVYGAYSVAISIITSTVNIPPSAPAGVTVR